MPATNAGQKGSAMHDLELTSLVKLAVLDAPCFREGCRLSVEMHRWRADLIHLRDHVCTTCPPSSRYPRHMVSLSSLYAMSRTELTGQVTAWLKHLHMASQPELLDADRAAVDADLVLHGAPPTAPHDPVVDAGAGVGSD